jgi:hypothetical protein
MLRKMTMPGTDMPAKWFPSSTTPFKHWVEEFKRIAEGEWEFKVIAGMTSPSRLDACFTLIID